jgi:aminoglycoside phosphotransferase (APT) family kinase protein
MTKNIRLLNHLRNAAARINSTTDNTEYKILMSAADLVLNELMLQSSTDFYLSYFEQGKKLLAEGKKLAGEISLPVLRDDLTTETRFDIFDAQIVLLHEALVVLVNALDESRSPAEKDFLNRLSDWESGLYEHSAGQASSAVTVAVQTIEPADFQAYLQKKFPAWKDVRVTKFAVLDGGFSKKTIMVQTEDGLNGVQEMVIRAELLVSFLCFEGSDVTQEFHSIQLMRQAGLPIAEPLWLEDDRSHLGMRFIVSRRAIGKTVGGNFRNNEEMSPEQVQSMMNTFIKMHSIKLDPADPLAQKSHFKEWLGLKTVRDATHYYVTVFMPRLIKLTGLPASPQVIRALKWLERNIPDATEPPVVLHIDFSFNNLIFDQHGITAVLDWESSRLGDPAEDIIHTQLNMRDFYTMPEFLEIYRAGTGREISEYRIIYFTLAKAVLNVITCLGALSSLTNSDGANIAIATLAFRYQAIFAPQLNALIAAAEAIK